jgi:hypothetical protein
MYNDNVRAKWSILSCIQTGYGWGSPVFQISKIRIAAYTEYNNHLNTAIATHFLSGPAGQGRASGCNALTTNLDLASRYLQNIKGKQTDLPAKQLATLYRVHVSPLMNRSGWKEIILKKVYVYTYALLNDEDTS